MGVATRKSSNNAKSSNLQYIDVDKLPHGWKTITAKGAKNKETTYYISPDGKRFLTIDSARTYISQNVFNQNEITAARKRRRSMDTLEEEVKQLRKAKRGKFAEGVLNNNSDSEDEKEDAEDLKISPEIKRRRKSMAMRSPFRNLLKKTLKKTHAKNIRNEMIKADSKENSPVKQVNSSPPVKQGLIFAKKSKP